MKSSPSQRISNGLYILWGVIHLAIGASTAAIQGADGSRKALEQMAEILPSETLPEVIPGVVDGVLAQHSWNLIWIGLTSVTLVVVGRKQPIPRWILLVITGATEVGLVISLSVTGFETLFPVIIGPIIWLLAVGTDVEARKMLGL